jgi:hypothetical protein
MLSMAGQTAPTPSHREAVRIVSVPLAGELAVLFCGPIEGLLVHRYQGRGWGCPGEESCLPVVHRSRTLYYGYAPAHVWRPRQEDWCPGVLEITEALEELLRGRRLVGEVWLLQRQTTKKKTGPVGGVLLECKDPGVTPPAFDIRAPLYRLYHSTTLQLGVPNPLPRKLLLPPVKMDPPPGPAAFGLAEAPTPGENQAEALRRLAPRGLDAAAAEATRRNGHEKR